MNSPRWQPGVAWDCQKMYLTQSGNAIVIMKNSKTIWEVIFLSLTLMGVQTLVCKFDAK
jgi:hypothetical protein